MTAVGRLRVALWALALGAVLLAGLAFTSSARAQDIPSGYEETLRTFVMAGTPTQLDALAAPGAVYFLQGGCDGPGGTWSGPWLDAGAWGSASPVVEWPWAQQCEGLWGSPPDYYLYGVNVVVAAPIASPPSPGASAALSWQDARELSWGVLVAWFSVAAVAYLATVVRG